MPRKIIRPVFVGLLSGLLASTGLVYYASKALSPGILGMFALVVIGTLFGIFVGLLSGTAFFMVGLKKFFSFDDCSDCGKQIPKNASFCPYCGKQPVRLNLIRL